jgi:hypothetical protein
MLIFSILNIVRHGDLPQLRPGFTKKIIKQILTMYNDKILGKFWGVGYIYI